MPNYYYYDTNGQKYGLIDDQQLRSLAAQGIITPNTPLETEGGHRGTAGQIPGLFPNAPHQPPTQPNTNSRIPLSRRKYEQINKYFTSPGGCFAPATITDDEYERMVRDKLNGLGLKNRAIAKIGLHPDQLKEIPPVFLHGYSFDKIGEDSTAAVSANQLLKLIPVIGDFLPSNAPDTAGGAAQTLTKVGTDGLLRTSKYDATWLFFSSTQIYVYKYTLDMTSDSMKEVIREYFYKDITNFSTVFTSITSPPPPPPNATGCLSNNTGCLGGGQRTRENFVFMLIVPGDEFSCSIGGVADAEKSVHAMKQLMRKKKG